MDRNRPKRVLTIHLFISTSCPIQDGSVKLSIFSEDKLKETAVICEYEHPVLRIAQSMTGNMLTVSVGNEE